MRKAFIFDLDTGNYLYDFRFIYPDENGEYYKPKNTTWDEPKKDDGSPFILPKYEDGKWVESGTPPEPSVPEPTETDLLGQALVEEKLRRIRTEQQVSDLGTQLVQEKLDGIKKEEQLQTQAQAIQDLGEQIVAMRLQQILNEGGTQS